MVAVLADLVVVLHLGFILFAVAGGLLALRWLRAPWFHIPALAWAVLIESMGWVCPLTPLENWLRGQAGGAAYELGFIEHYVVPIIYPPGLTVETQWLLAALLLSVNFAVYCWVCQRRLRGRSVAT